MLCVSGRQVGGAGAGHNVCNSSKNVMHLGSGYKYFTDLLKTINVASVGSLDERGDERGALEVVFPINFLLRHPKGRSKLSSVGPPRGCALL